MFKQGDTAIYYRNFKQYKKGYKFKVMRVHPTGHWVYDSLDNAHAIWHLRTLDKYERIQNEKDI